MRSPAAPLAVLPALLLGFAAPLRAQDGDAIRRIDQRLRELDRAREEVAPDAPLSDRLLVDYGGSAQFGLYSIDDETSESHILREYDGRAWMSAELDGIHRFFGRLKFRYDDWNTGDDFDGEGDDLREPIGERWWYELSLEGRNALGGADGVGLDAKIGKQYVQWGEGLVFSNVLIGALVEIDWGALELSFLAGDTPPNDFVDFDASRPSFDTNTKRRFVGLHLEMEGAFTPFVQVLLQADHNDRSHAVFVDSTGQVFPTNFRYHSIYLGLGGRGAIGEQTQLHGEVDYEGGRSFSSPISAAGTPTTQTAEDIRAWAAAAGVTHVFRDARASRMDLDVIVGSGDDDRLDSADTFGGNLTGTDDTAFNAFGLLNTGLALAPDPSNLVISRLGVSMAPFSGDGGTLERMRASIDGFVFVKLDEKAPINVPTTDDRFVGSELDFGLDWNLLSDVAVSFRYGLFFPGSAMPDGEDDVRQFVYGSVAYAF
jgi:hypothetical protein